MTDDLDPRMDHICKMCGLTWGSHCADSRGEMCPDHEDRMDFPSDGRGTRFVETGRYAKVPRGTPRNHLAAGADERSGGRMTNEQKVQPDYDAAMKIITDWDAEAAIDAACKSLADEIEKLRADNERLKSQLRVALQNANGYRGQVVTCREQLTVQEGRTFSWHQACEKAEAKVERLDKLLDEAYAFFLDLTMSSWAIGKSARLVVLLDRIEQERGK